MNKKEIKKYIPAIVASIVIIVIIILLLVFNENANRSKFKLNEVGPNSVIEDLEGMMIYNRFQVENGMLFDLVGSNGYKDYFGYYYKKEVSELPDFLKVTILANDADYRTWNYDEINRCYRLNSDDYNIIYDKLFGNSEEKELIIEQDFENNIIVDDDSICISDNMNSSYDKVIDTYLVNIVRLDDKIVIYESVAFIDIEDDFIYFYKDYEMKELVYKLKVTNKLDMSFINNSEVVSNVLLEYQNELDIYEYTYVKGEDTYYLESIKK